MLETGIRLFCAECGELFNKDLRKSTADMWHLEHNTDYDCYTINCPVMMQKKFPGLERSYTNHAWLNEEGHALPFRKRSKFMTNVEMLKLATEADELLTQVHRSWDNEEAGFSDLVEFTKTAATKINIIKNAILSTEVVEKSVLKELRWKTAAFKMIVAIIDKMEAEN